MRSNIVFPRWREYAGLAHALSTRAPRFRFATEKSRVPQHFFPHAGASMPGWPVR
jgi:hypothetical protein